MESSKLNRPYTCPVGETNCDWLQELDELRARVDTLTELVSHDQLTGVYNFRHFSETLPRVLERTRRSLSPSCMIIIDLDHFKRINDIWGHEIGNLALKQASRIITQQVRMVDIVCRYGGEEFVVILPDTNLRQAVEVAERVRRAIADTPVIFDEGEFSFTASMGVDVYRSEEPVVMDDFIRNVDGFLYEAKEQGRNQVRHRSFDEIESVNSISQEEKSALFDLFNDGAAD